MHINLGLSLALVLVFAGVLVMIIGYLGRRAKPIEVALLVIALIVFAGVVSTVSYSASGTKTYSASKSQISVSRIAINASSKFGSISVRFSGNADLGYQVVFTQTEIPFFQVFGNNSISLTNVTRDGTFFLNANASNAGITITLGAGYFVSIDADTGTGSVDINSSSLGQEFGGLSLSTGTGSISAQIDSSNVSSIDMSTGTGSVSFDSTYLAPSRNAVPLTLSTGTGSLSFYAMIPATAGANISATDGFGSISRSLTGFNVIQSSNNQLNAAEGSMKGSSFAIELSVGTGSLSVTCSLVSTRA